MDTVRKPPYVRKPAKAAPPDGSEVDQEVIDFRKALEMEMNVFAALMNPDTPPVAKEGRLTLQEIDRAVAETLGGKLLGGKSFLPDV